MSEDINKILELTTNEVGEIIIDYIDKNGITKEWKYSSDKEILNYITNLQQKYDAAIFVGKELNKSLEDYKSRCEKAIDVLEELIAEFQLNDYITDFDKKMNKPLNILQGSDNNDYNEK